MGAYFPSEAVVTIGAADAVSSAGTAFTSYITNFTQSGGTRDIESIPVFGGGNVDKENPREQVEVQFECIIQGATPLLFDQLIAGSSLDGTTAVSYADDPVKRTIYVEVVDAETPATMTRAYNNAEAVTWEPEMSADEYMKGTITFKLSPTDAAGSTNVKIVKAAASTVTW